jgi:peptidoglycan-N-acetylglucosamine deacetylase
MITKRRKLARLGAALVVAALVAAAGLFALSRSRRYQVFGELVSRVETDDRVVALTLDDGPTPEGTDAILRVLEAKGVRATFFLTGAEIERCPELARKIAAAGHEIGNHSYAHERMVMMSQARIAEEVERTDALIRETGYDGPILFRPPYGKKLFGLPYYLEKTGRTSVMCDVEPDSFDEAAASPDWIVAHVLERARPGSIVLLHVMYPSRRSSLDAVAGVVDALRADGYRFVTASELLALGGR